MKKLSAEKHSKRLQRVKSMNEFHTNVKKRDGKILTLNEEIKGLTQKKEVCICYEL